MITSLVVASSTARSTTSVPVRTLSAASYLPVGRKQLDGWNWYLNFMLNLKDAVLRVDPVAEVHIVEAAG